MACMCRSNMNSCLRCFRKQIFALAGCRPVHSFASLTPQNKFCRHPWPLARSRATNLGSGRSPAVHASGVRSGRSCHAPPTRPGKSPARPAVGSGRSSHTRLQQPASRSASGRVLSPPSTAVRPNAWPTGVRGQRASRPASGAHPTHGRPVCCRHAPVRARPVHQPARAAKASLQLLSR